MTTGHSSIDPFDSLAILRRQTTARMPSTYRKRSRLGRRKARVYAGRCPWPSQRVRPGRRKNWNGRAWDEDGGLFPSGISRFVKWRGKRRTRVKASYLALLSDGNTAGIHWHGAMQALEGKGDQSRVQRGRSALDEIIGNRSQYANAVSQRR